MGGELPISVIVPHQRSRKDFFFRYCLPSIQANDPEEVVVVENDGSLGSGAAFRNDGAKRAKAPFLFFADDDLILANDCLKRLLLALWYHYDPAVRYSYSDYVAVTMPEARRIHEHAVSVVKTSEFARSTARTGSICSSMILIDRASFCGFDETLRQLDDWDLVLTLLERGVNGVRVPETLFHAYYLDAGVSDKETVVSAVHAVQRKHRMLPGA